MSNLKSNGPFTKDKDKIKEIKETGNSRYLIQDLSKRTT